MYTARLVSASMAATASLITPASAASLFSTCRRNHLLSSGCRDSTVPSAEHAGEVQSNTLVGTACCPLKTTLKTHHEAGNSAHSAQMSVVTEDAAWAAAHWEGCTHALQELLLWCSTDVPPQTPAWGDDTQRRQLRPDRLLPGPDTMAANAPSTGGWHPTD